MAEENFDEAELETLEIRSAAWYKKKLKYSQIIYQVDEKKHVATIILNMTVNKVGLRQSVTSSSCGRGLELQPAVRKQLVRRSSTQN